MKKINVKAWVLLISLGFLCLFLPSCKKATDCPVEIIVLDISKVPVSGASVHLFSNEQGANLQDETQTSDASGKASFVFKYEAILNIAASKDSLKNIGGIIKLKPGSIPVTQTVIIR